MATDPAGDRPPTIRTVAARAGVSKSLVSLVLQNSTRVSAEKRRAVLKAVAELGYRPDPVWLWYFRRASLTPSRPPQPQPFHPGSDRRRRGSLFGRRGFEVMSSFGHYQPYT